jgi:hypothetical protein
MRAQNWQKNHSKKSSPRNQLPSYVSTKTYLFNGGTSLNWAAAKRQLIAEFQLKDCWDLVQTPVNLIPQIDPITGDYGVVPEVTFLKPEPQYVVQVEEAFDLYCGGIYLGAEEELDEIEDTDLSDEEKERERWRINSGVRKAEREFETKYMQLEERFNAMHAVWASENEKFNKRVANCVEVFTRNLGPTATKKVYPELQDHRFRQAWLKLEQDYSTTRGGNQARHQLKTLLSNACYHGGSFTDHCDYMNLIYSQMDGIGLGLQDSEKRDYLIMSIKKGESKIFDRVIEYYEFNDQATYAEVVQKMEKLHINYQMEKNLKWQSQSRKNSERSNYSSAKTVKDVQIGDGETVEAKANVTQKWKPNNKPLSFCKFCNKECRHTEETCWAKDPSKAPPNWKRKRSSSNTAMDGPQNKKLSQEDTSSKPNMKEGEKVSLKENYRRKHPVK